MFHSTNSLAPLSVFTCKHLHFCVRAIWAHLLLILIPGSISAIEAPEIDNEYCIDCHGLSDMTRELPDGGEESVFVDPARFEHSVHQESGCWGCHQDLTWDHPDDEVAAAPVDCAACHEDQPGHLRAAEEYSHSIHGTMRRMGGKAPATCVDCHGLHEIRSINDPLSSVFKFNLPFTCAKCHTNDTMAADEKMRNPEAAEHYLDSMHGRALLKMGLVVAPSCNDCHGVHDIRPSTVEGSPIHPTRINATCGACHVKVEEIYNQSVHGQLLAQGNPDAPICTDCHTAHEIEDPLGAHFKSTTDQKCGKCHEEAVEYYHETYHGKAMQLGKPNTAPTVAACYDCHGHHDVRAVGDPSSRLSSDNIVQTCSACHEGATKSFALYAPHASHYDKENYPQFYWTFFFMTSLLLGVFTFFGAHTAFWLFRSAYLYWTDSKTYREAKVNTQNDKVWFTRFTPYERFLHLLVVTSFLLLVITGMPLKFYDTEWAKVLFAMLGGPDVARALHHFGAIITFLYFTLHLVSLVSNMIRRRAEFRHTETGRFSLKRFCAVYFGPDSMIPSRHDWKDFVAHQKWFFGKGKKPQFDRWTYWEKFDYFSVFWGIFAIGVSGLIMWFPLFFTKFMPGWMINIALIIHSDEALLAAGFIFTVHFFNTHLRLEKFPMDTVIFSGRVSEGEMLHERKRWYDRLVAENRIEEQKVRDEWPRWRTIARTAGYLFFGIGVVLLVLIVYAMAMRMLQA